MPAGTAWLTQSIQVPGEGTPVLRFWDRTFTYERDHSLQDGFGYLEVLGASQQVLRDMKREEGMEGGTSRRWICCGGRVGCTCRRDGGG